jgi:hypothetical protein
MGPNTHYVQDLAIMKYFNRKTCNITMTLSIQCQYNIKDQDLWCYLVHLKQTFYALEVVICCA